MIEQIEISNFRCFKNTKIKGFRRVNLIGGKNNSGKTALLEALFLSNVPANPVVTLLQKLRGEDEKTSSKVPEKAWENLFYNQNINNKILLSILNGIEHRVELICDENIDDFVRYFDKDEDKKDDEILFRNTLVHQRKKSVLHIQAFKNNEKFTSTTLVASGLGMGGNGEGIADIDKVDFIPSKYHISDEALASDFDMTYEKGGYEDLLKALKIVDDSISDARTSSIGDPVIKIRRDGEKPMSLSSFGDAIYKVVSIVLKALNAHEGGILLIDEIENGLHYSVQERFWELLFEFAQRFGLQIFATSHSLEMISAFNRVAQKPQFEKDAMYFEMFRQPNTQQIVANPLDMSMLNYKIIKGEPLRGEI